MQDAKWIWLSPEHFPQHQKGQATQFAPKGDFVIARFEKDVFRRKRDCRYRNFRRREISAVDKRNFNLDRSGCRWWRLRQRKAFGLVFFKQPHRPG